MDGTWHGGAGTDLCPLTGVTLQPNLWAQPFSLLPAPSSSQERQGDSGRRPKCSPRSTQQLPTLPTYSTHSFGEVLPCPSAPPGWDLAQSPPALAALPAAPFRIPVWAGPAALPLPPPPWAAFQLLLNSVQAGFITRALKRLQTNRKNREQERAERSIGAGGG